MILDATAGNRIVWQDKHPENVTFMDFQRKLERKPTIFADNRNMPFRDKTFSTVFFDPPHAWAFRSIFFGFPDRDSYIRNHPNDRRRFPVYYGMELYRSKSALLKAIYDGLKEVRRVLKDDGLLWLNWSELRLSLNRILVLFGNDWTELIRLHVTSPYQNLSSHRNYWVCFRKRNHHMSVSARSDDLDQWFGGARIC